MLTSGIFLISQYLEHEGAGTYAKITGQTRCRNCTFMLASESARQQQPEQTEDVQEQGNTHQLAVRVSYDCKLSRTVHPVNILILFRTKCQKTHADLRYLSDFTVP